MADTRRNRNAHRESGTGTISGPTSALGSYLRSQGISFEQNLQLIQQRRREFEQHRAEHENASREEGLPVLTPEARKRKAAEEKAIEKIKKSKKFQREKARARGAADSTDDALARRLLEFDVSVKAGQLENCAKCSKRFTVTPYTKAGPNGGLLCPKCAKEVDDADDKPAAKKKKPPTIPGFRRRQTRAHLLDGVAPRGAQSLFQLCLQRVADEINDVDDFGDMTAPVLEQIGRILSRQRTMNSHTIGLFIKPEYDSITVHDAAELSTDDFMKMFMVAPGITEINLTNAGQFKDEVLDYITGHPDIKIVHFRVGAANLIIDPVWRTFFKTKGQYLKTVKVTWLDGHFDDETLGKMIEHCTQLERLKLDHLWKITATSIERISELGQLRHLTLKRPFAEITSESMLKILEKVGHQLETFCLDDYSDLDDAVLTGIHEKCRVLQKLRLTNNKHFTDAAFVKLFSDWANPALQYITFSKTRDVNADEPVANQHGRGLCGEGFKAMMAHSWARMQHVDVTSCRHITHEALMSVFDGVNKYPQLKYLNVSFCGAVDDTIVAGVFRSCPNIKELEIFGCFNVQDPVIPRDVRVVGHPCGSGDLVVVGE